MCDCGCVVYNDAVSPNSTPHPPKPIDMVNTSDFFDHLRTQVAISTYRSYRSEFLRILAHFKIKTNDDFDKNLAAIRKLTRSVPINRTGSGKACANRYEKWIKH